MTRQMLRGISVSGKEELEERTCRYFDEVNAEPVAVAESTDAASGHHGNTDAAHARRGKHRRRLRRLHEKGSLCSPGRPKAAAWPPGATNQRPLAP